MEQWLQYLPQLQQWFWLYIDRLQAISLRPRNILGTLCVMTILYVVATRKSGGRFSLRSAWSFMFPKEIYLHPSAKLSYRFYAVAPLVRKLLFGPAMAIPVNLLVFEGMHGLLRDQFGAPAYTYGLAEPYPLWFLVVFTMGTALIADFGIFLQHFAMHKIPFLWEFHKVHHSAEVLTPITFWQHHPIDGTSIVYIIGAFIGATQALVGYFFIPNLGLYDVLAPNLFLIAYYALAYNFLHSHFYISWGPALNHVLISPALHHIHHSSDERHADRNFGTIFALWDWMFGTLYVPKEKEDLKFGLWRGEQKEFQTVKDLYWLPFKKNIAAGRAWAVLLLLGFLLFGILRTTTKLVERFWAALPGGAA